MRRNRCLMLSTAMALALCTSLPSIASAEQSPGTRVDVHAQPAAPANDPVGIKLVAAPEVLPGFGTFSADTGPAVHYLTVSVHDPLVHMPASPIAKPSHLSLFADALLLGGAGLYGLSRYMAKRADPYWRPFGDYKSVCSTG